MKKYRNIALRTIISIPIHAPIMLLFIMIIAGGMQDINSLTIQYLVVLLCIAIELLVHSKLNAFINKRLNPKITRKQSIISQSIILVLIIIAYSTMLLLPIIYKL